jgi:hypothetical protein
MAKELEVKFEKELGRVALPQEEVLVFRAVEYGKGGLRFDIRKYYTVAPGDLRPTSKGASLKPDWIDDLRRALDAFEKVPRK